MSYLYRPFGLFFLLLAIVLGLQLALQKPPCIESSIVYKIDKVGKGSTESIFACGQFKAVPFSVFFFDNLAHIQRKINKVEPWLATLGISRKFVIVVNQNEPARLTELLNGIEIGSALLDGNLLAKSLLVKSLREKTGIIDTPFLEAIADFLIGDSDYQNFISEAWGDALAQLNFIERYKLTKIVVNEYRRPVIGAKSSGVDGLEMLLLRSGHPEIVSVFRKKLNERGYYAKNELSSLQLDLVLEYGANEAPISELTALSVRYRNLKSAVKKSDGMFLLPSMLKIPSEFENSIFVRQRLSFAGPLGARRLESFLENTESLMLIKTVKSVSSMDVRAIYEGGVSEFIRRNKEMQFVQFHLPSFKLVYKNLNSVLNYFDFIDNKDNSEKALKILGWDRTEWLTEIRAYRPIANFDAIQYYRIN